MSKNAYFLVFDGLADWEAGLALCEINKQPNIDVVTVGFSKDNITTMGGLRILPQTTIEEINIEQACVFILPGGDMWSTQTHQELVSLLHQLHKKNVLIAAICGATLMLARAELLKGIRHTSNAKEYLKEHVKSYQEEECYVEELAVTDKNIITASGVGSIEFTYEIIKYLGLYSEEDSKNWFNLFKHGILP